MAAPFTSPKILSNEGRFFLLAGMAVEIVYILGDIVGGLITPDYSYIRNTASQLMAIGAENRLFMSPFYFVHSVLIAIFGYGLISRFDYHNFRLLNVGGRLLILIGICYALACSVFPMDPPSFKYSFNGYMHVFLVATGVTSIFFLIPTISQGTFTYFKWKSFRRLSNISLPFIIIAAVLSPIILIRDIELMGFTERIIGHLFSIWLFILAYRLYNETYISVLFKKQEEAANLKSK